jgi:hypothetical protein
MDNLVFTKERLASFAKVATPHKESSLLGVERGGLLTCLRFRWEETHTKRGTKNY